MSPVHTLPYCFFYIHFNNFLASTPISSQVFFLCIFLFSVKRATCLAYPILLHSTAVIFGEKYRLRSFKVCNFPQFAVIFSLLGRNILTFTNMPGIFPSLNVREQVAHQY
jgi:hypothetical protein